MVTYRFDPKTKEFLGCEKAYLDPLESKKQGKEVYLLPANSTFTEPRLERKYGLRFEWQGVGIGRGLSRKDRLEVLR